MNFTHDIYNIHLVPCRVCVHMYTKKVSCELHEQDVPLVWMMSRRIPGSYGDRYRRYIPKVQIFYFKIKNYDLFSEN